jgi:hypothetical protein
MSIFTSDYEDPTLKYANLELLNQLSFEEIKLDAANFKPSGIPMVDMLLIKNFGNFITCKIALNQWEKCPDIINEIYKELNDKFPEINIEHNSIKEIGDNLYNEKKNPIYIDSRIDEFTRQIFKSKYFITTSILDKSSEAIETYELRFQVYLKSVNLSNQIMNDIISKYKEEWNKIQTNFDTIYDILEKNFEEVEEDERYIISENMIDNINDDAKSNIDQVLPVYIDKLKLKYQSASDETNPFSNNLIMDKYYKEIQEEFSEKIDKIYYSILKKYNFDDEWCDKLISFFDNEKYMHKMGLSLDVMHLMLRQL